MKSFNAFVLINGLSYSMNATLQRSIHILQAFNLKYCFGLKFHLTQNLNQSSLLKFCNAPSKMPKWQSILLYLYNHGSQQQPTNLCILFVVIQEAATSTRDFFNEESIVPFILVLLSPWITAVQLSTCIKAAFR